MKIKDILKVKGSKVWMIKANQTVRSAVQILVNQKIGALVVADPRSSRIVGIISERDIMRGCYSGQNLDTTLVSELMSRGVITGFPEEEINEVMALMTENRVRHIPVLDRGELQGIVSIGDVVKALLEESRHQIRHLQDYMYGSSL